ISRQSSLRNIYQEFERLGVTVDSTDEAVRYLDWIESAHNVSVSAATLGDDYIAIRPEVRGNARILLEEPIHVHQSRLGMVTTSNSVELEIVARYVILENRHLWGITSSEADMLYQEIMYMVETGSY